MKTAREVLAGLGINENHPGPFTYQELLEVAEAALGEPDIHSPEWVRREQEKGNAFLMAPARITHTGPLYSVEDLKIMDGLPFLQRLPNEDTPPF